MLTPTLLAPTTGHQIRFHRAVADGASVPVWPYKTPAVTGYDLPVAAVIPPNILGIKDSAGMPERIAEIRPNCPNDFLISAGASRTLAAGRRVVSRPRTELQQRHL